MNVFLIDRSTDPEMLGLIPNFIDENDPRPAAEQFHENYAHGGGWHDFPGFLFDKKTGFLKYPGDPAYKPLALMRLRDEVIIVYPHAWVLILQKDGSFSVSRMD